MIIGSLPTRWNIALLHRAHSKAMGQDNLIDVVLKGTESVLGQLDDAKELRGEVYGAIEKEFGDDYEQAERDLAKELGARCHGNEVEQMLSRNTAFCEGARTAINALGSRSPISPSDLQAFEMGYALSHGGEYF